MKKILLMGGVMVVLFTISAGSSWILKSKQAPHGEPEPAESIFVGKDKKGDAHPPGGGAPASELRPAVKPPYLPEADAAAKIFSSLNSQKEALQAREQQFVARQKSMEIIYLDIRTERAALDEMRKQLNDQLNHLATKVESMERKAGEVEQKQKELGDQDKELKNTLWRKDKAEEDSVKRLAEVFNSMEAEAAAQSLQHMADSGKIETAAKILSEMRERQAAKVLAAFPDRTTVVQILDKLRSFERMPAPTKNGT